MILRFKVSPNDLVVHCHRMPCSGKSIARGEGVHYMTIAPCVQPAHKRPSGCTHGMIEKNVYS